MGTFGRGALRRLWHVALADVRQRVRSRRFVAVLAVVLYVGFQLNVGAFELAFVDAPGGERTLYRGVPTAAYVGLTTGVTGATLLLFGGFTILSGSIARDEASGAAELLASTPMRDTTYLLGKWASHCVVAAIVLAALASGALVRHVAMGTGATDPVWIVGATFLVGLPLGCLVAGITILFLSTERLDGPLGTITFVFAAVVVLATVFAGASSQGQRVAPTVRIADAVGLFAAGEMTLDALTAATPAYGGPPVASYGMISAEGGVVPFRWTGDGWPAWFLLNRLGLVLLGVGLTAAATLPYVRYADEPTDDAGATPGKIRRLLAFPSLPNPASAAWSRRPAFAAPSTVPGGRFVRLLVQELRLLVRGQPWWWYVGALAVGTVGLAGVAPRSVIVPLAAIWPLFVWSPMGYRAIHHRVYPFVVSSPQPYGQLLAEWAAGLVVSAAFAAVALWPTVLGTGAGGALVLASAVVFPPSLALAIGTWTRTRRVFELLYLALWYVGPLNGLAVLDFAGATGTAGIATPLAFVAVGLFALGATLAHRARAV